jgi:uncharacterized protein (DUF362 family)/NAD-dependent dihydropyrimidine dehydrogenase PreA subunit
MESAEFSNILDEVDVILNVPKLKSDEITFLAGSIKNCLGLISPDSRKLISSYDNKFNYSQGIVDVYSYLKSKIALTVMDAIESIQGNDKSLNDSTYRSNFIIISRDGLSVDALAAHLTNHTVTSIPTNLIAWKNDLGFIEFNKFNIMGENPKDLICDDFEKTNLSGPINLKKRDDSFDASFVYEIIPKNSACVFCMNCVNSCPTGAIYFNSEKICVDKSKCIHCYTCKEFCPKGEFILRKISK